MVALPEHDALLVFVLYLSDATRARLRERGVNYLDLTGNARITLQSPGLFIETSGADSAPSVPAGTRTLRIPGGVREIAERVGADPGYVSRVLSILDDEAVVRRERRKLVCVDWKRLLGRWVQDARLCSRGARTSRTRGARETTRRLGQVLRDRFLRCNEAGPDRATSRAHVLCSGSGERGADGINYVPTAQVAADLLGDPRRRSGRVPACRGGGPVRRAVHDRR